MLKETDLKALKVGDTLFIGPRDKRSPPRGIMIVVRKGTKWLYVARQSDIDRAKESNSVPECWQERIAIKDWGNYNHVPKTGGYPSLDVYRDEADFAYEQRKAAMRSVIQTEMSGGFNLSQLLSHATDEQLDTLHCIVVELKKAADR